MSPNKGLEYLSWMSKADGDRSAARIEALNQNHPDIACYLLQQSLEKYIKAQIVSYGVEPPKTHRIEVLLDELSRSSDLQIPLSLVRPATQISALEARTRYPGDEFTYQDFMKATQRYDTLAMKLRELGYEIPAWGSEYPYLVPPETYDG